MKAPGKLARLQNTAKPPTTQLHLCTLTLIRHSPRSLTSRTCPCPLLQGSGRAAAAGRGRTPTRIPDRWNKKAKGQRQKTAAGRRRETPTVLALTAAGMHGAPVPRSRLVSCTRCIAASAASTATLPKHDRPRSRLNRIHLISIRHSAYNAGRPENQKRALHTRINV